jgi:Asp-tRNA(Asn)/Glu-tRNA(Gln) amidotransferase B subunit
MIYLDNAATTFPKPEEVYLAMDKANREMGVNAGRGAYRLAKDASKLIEFICDAYNLNHLVDDYKAGKRVFDYFIGQIMKKTRGRANPVITSRILKEELDK